VTIQDASAIVQRLGPCRIAIDRTAYAELARELALVGCDVTDIPTEGASIGANGPSAGFLSWTHQEPKLSFADAIHPFERMNALILHSTGQERQSLEPALFDAGWRRHPAGMGLGEYPAWSSRALPAVSYYQRAPHGGCGVLQEGGLNADATIARYAMAANHVRPGDHILVDGEGSIDGSAILLALSRASSITRVDPTAGTTRWRPYDGCGCADADLAGVADNSIDLIVALEPAVPTSWMARLDDYARVLKHDGRIVLGWRRNARGNSAPRDWEGLASAASDRFLPEARYVQIPVSADLEGPHALLAVSLDQPIATEWLLLVASANPLLGEGLPGYTHPVFSQANGPQPALVDFAAAYDNPYLYRSMVQMGERLGDDLKLARLAECVIEDARADSADRGAAIAVLGYRVLELRLEGLVSQILPLIEDYTSLPLDETAVHVCRWRISLAFLAGRLNEFVGDRAAAKRWYRTAAEGKWETFSPLLATKTIAASFYEARLCLADGDNQTALACFQHGVEAALKAAAFPHAEQIGPADRPLPFYLQELAEVIDMGSQCANALAHFPLWQRDPGLFWRQVDVRRFGLASWARDLERENQRLRAG